jgi:hypothetical protein
MFKLLNLFAQDSFVIYECLQIVIIEYDDLFRDSIRAQTQASGTPDWRQNLEIVSTSIV